MKLKCNRCGLEVSYNSDTFYQMQCPRCRALEKLHNPMAKVEEDDEERCVPDEWWRDG